MRKQARLPEHLRHPVVATMKQDRTYYTVPWALRADEDDLLWLEPRMQVMDKPGGTFDMKVELRSDGYHVWIPGDRQYPVRVAGAGLLPVAALGEGGEPEPEKYTLEELKRAGRETDTLWSSMNRDKLLDRLAEQVRKNRKPGSSPNR